MESNLVAEFVAETGADKTVAYSYLQGTSMIVWKFVSGHLHKYQGRFVLKQGVVTGWLGFYSLKD
jgi:hypothetical protein